MSELYHHGIPGQKWGVQNGPPYPLDATTSHVIQRQAELRDHEILKRGLKFAGIATAAAGAVIVAAILNKKIGFTNMDIEVAKAFGHFKTNKGPIELQNRLKKLKRLRAASIAAFSGVSSGLLYSEIKNDVELSNGKKYLENYFRENPNVTLQYINDARDQYIKKYA